MKSLITDVLRLPPSLSARLGGRCRSVREAEVAYKLAEELCGAKAGLMMAYSGFRIPVQYHGGATVQDIVWLVGELTRKEKNKTKNTKGTAESGKQASTGRGSLGGRRKEGDTTLVGNGRKFRNNNIKDGGLEDRFFEVVTQCALELRESPRLPTRGADNKVSPFVRSSAGCWWEGFERDTVVFPKKVNKGVVKQNLRFDDVWSDVRDFYPEVAYIVGTRPRLLKGMYNDEAVGWLMWMCGSYANMGPGVFGIVELLALDEGRLKMLNVVVKALGLQRERWGPDLCELTTLAGRGVGVDPPFLDIRTRIDKGAFLREKAAVCERSRLSECISAVIRSELPTRPTWAPKEDYWTRRWLYTKSGAHSQYVEDSVFGHRSELPPLPTRREFAEVVQENLVGKGDPKVEAGHSYKEEHGKTRHIYSCDSISYFTFDYLLRPIEKIWKNSRVLLDPGRELQSSRYKRLGSIPGYRYMLDFDDFNSQHEHWAMQEVIRLACEGAPPDVLDWAVKSWENTYVHWLGDRGVMERERMVGTLPSGHRATTFVNTILNAAYCMYAAGELYSELTMYHCGDDVVVFGSGENINSLCIKILASPFRINPAKQSVGRWCGEFLRVAFWETEATGYGARGISSLVSGNWVTETRLDKKSYIETILRGLWTICSRFDNAGLGVLAKSSLLRRVPELSGLVHKLVTHQVSWDGSPVTRHVTGQPVMIVRPSGGLRLMRRERLVAYHATNDFLSNHVDFTMLEATDYTPGMLASIMRKASEKPRGEGDETPLSYTLEESNSWFTAEANRLALLESREDTSRSEALNILQQILSKVEWHKLVGKVRNVVPTAYYTTGSSPWPVLATYTLPFADAMALRRKLSCTTSLSINYKVRV